VHKDQYSTYPITLQKTDILPFIPYFGILNTGDVIILVVVMTQTADKHHTYRMTFPKTVETINWLRDTPIAALNAARKPFCEAKIKEQKGKNLHVDVQELQHQLARTSQAEISVSTAKLEMQPEAWFDALADLYEAKPKQCHELIGYSTRRLSVFLNSNRMTCINAIVVF